MDRAVVLQLVVGSCYYVPLILVYLMVFGLLPYFQDSMVVCVVVGIRRRRSLYLTIGLIALIEIILSIPTFLLCINRPWVDVLDKFVCLTIFQYYLFERLKVIVGPFCSDNRPQVYVTCKYQMDKFGYGYCTSVCAICLEEYKREEECAMLHECRHTFHHGCLRKWLAKTTSCPLCRQRLYTNIDNSMVLGIVTPF